MASRKICRARHEALQAMAKRGEYGTPFHALRNGDSPRGHAVAPVPGIAPNTSICHTQQDSPEGGW